MESFNFDSRLGERFVMASIVLPMIFFANPSMAVPAASIGLLPAISRAEPALPNPASFASSPALIRPPLTRP
jgi:hypothetical protein